MLITRPGVALKGKSPLLPAVLCLALVGAGCGGSSITPPVPPGPLGTGALVLSVQDDPLDDLIEFEITIDSAVLNPGDVSVLAGPVRLELTSLQMSPEMIRLAPSIPAGTYNSITLTFSDPEIKFRDPVTGAIIEVKPPLVNATVEVAANITITANQASSLLIDFDLAASVQMDAGSNITGIDPVVTATVGNVAAEDDELDDVTGRVISIDRTDATTGAVVLESFGVCTDITLQVDSNTLFEGFDDANPPLENTFESLAVDQIIEIDADILSNGTFVAKEIELEETDTEDELEGLIVDANRNGLNQVTDFQMVLMEVVPCAATIPEDDRITITVPTDGSVRFRVKEEDFFPIPSWFDDPSDLEIGQKVEVDPIEVVDLTSTSFTAEKIKLNRQTIRGTVISATATTFELDPAASLFPDQSITVEVFSETRLDDLANGVAGLQAGDEVRVKGMLFRNAAGDLVMAALRIDGSP